MISNTSLLNSLSLTEETLKYRFKISRSYIFRGLYAHNVPWILPAFPKLSYQCNPSESVNSIQRRDSYLPICEMSFLIIFTLIINLAQTYSFHEVP